MPTYIGYGIGGTSGTTPTLWVAAVTQWPERIAFGWVGGGNLPPVSDWEPEECGHTLPSPEALGMRLAYCTLGAGHDEPYHEVDGIRWAEAD